MILKFSTCLLCASVFTGCTFTEPGKEDSILGSWRLYDIVPKDKEQHDFATEADLKKEVSEGSILSFFEDSSYSEVDGSGIFTSGKWRLRQRNFITLLDHNSETRDIRIKTESGMGKPFNSMQVERVEVVFKYRKTMASLLKPVNDPFYVSNNGWRTKSLKEETTRELYDKMAGYIRHLALVLKAAKIRKQEVVSFEFSKGPAKMYKGGVGIYPFAIVPQEWKDTFYNDSTASVAYSLFQKYLQESDYSGAGVGDWIEDNYNILLSIYADFNKSAR